jgi:hypothetical protein
MTDLRTAAQQALEALFEINWSNNSQWQSKRAESVIPALRAALAEEALQRLSDVHQEIEAALEQPEQEPVAWMDDFGNAFPLGAVKGAGSWRDDHQRNWTPLYTHPPRREWRGLTEEEIQSVIQLEREKRFQRRPPLPLSMTELSHAIEAALRSKNHD